MREKPTKDKEKLEKREEMLKQQFENLTKPQKELLLYRKIIEICKLENKPENYEDELLCLIKNAGIGYLKPLLLYSAYISESEYQKVYKESLIHYNKVLENYKDLAQELKISSSLDLSNILTYMLWNGYFSVNKQHTYNLQERLLLPGMNSFDVIKGKGVCLAYSELLNDYLSICEKESSTLICKIPEKKKDISYDYRPEIERNIKINISSRILSKFVPIFLSWLINKFGNHAITLIRENKNTYAYDPTNFYVLSIKDFSTACIINGKGEFKINPLMTLITNPHTDTNHIYEDILSNDFETTLTRKDFIFSFENIMEQINSNISLLDDAYDNIHKDLEYIDKQTNEIGRNYKILKKRKK